MYRWIARFESCISDMHRAVRAFTRLRRSAELSVAERARINGTKPVFVTAAVADRIRDMRNELQHIEEKLAKGELTGDLPCTVQPTGPETVSTDPAWREQTVKTIDRLRIAHYEVTFADLTAWLMEMVACVEKIRSLMPTSYKTSLSPESQEP
jgi:chromosome condensin MukBEF complex kleisin-like MukF subunit